VKETTVTEIYRRLPYSIDGTELIPGVSDERVPALTGLTVRQYTTTAVQGIVHRITKQQSGSVEWLSA